MPQWTVHLFGQPLLERDGESFKPRTIHQTLLIARLCAYHPSPLLRGDTACLLWPDASRERALTYLRRAIMELRRAEFPLIAQDDYLLIETSNLTCDLIGLREVEGWSSEFPPTDGLLPGIANPVADEVRHIVEATKHRISTDGPGRFFTPLSAVNNILARMGAFVSDYHPDIAVKFLAQNLQLFADSSLQETLLEKTRKATASSSSFSDDSLQLRLRAAKVARQRTKYRLAEEWLTQAMKDCQERGLFGSLAEVYGELSFLEMELRNWDAARRNSELAVEAAQKQPDPDTLSAAYDSLGRTQWQLRAYEESASNYLEAYRLSANRSKRLVILANLSFLRGILQVPVDLPEPEPLSDADGFYEAGAQSYAQFARHFGRREYVLAAKSAAVTVEITAKNDMDRFFCVALDCAAIAFAGLGRPVDAAACVRIGSRLRIQIGHRRAPMEKDSIRRHFPGPYFNSQIDLALRDLYSDDLTVMAARVSNRLRNKL